MSDKKINKAAYLFKLLEPLIQKIYFEESDDSVYVETLLYNGSKKLFKVRSTEFRRFATNVFYTKTENGISRNTIDEAIQIIEGKALETGKEIEVSTRIAGNDKKICIFLADQKKQAVRITAGNVEIVPATETGYFFIKQKGTLALPAPNLPGDFSKIEKYLTIKKDDDDFILFVAFLAMCFRQDGPFPILSLSGEQGSAKTTHANIIKKLVDPSAAEKKCMPRNEHEAALQGKHSWLLVYENISYISDWFSDFLCTLATGGGLSVRTLYENEEITIFDYKRPAILNGINDVISRPDLMDRAILIHLPTISEEERKPEKTFWRDFNNDLPDILGGLYTLLSSALQYHPVEVEKLPRMADFAIWGHAIEKAMNWETGAFATAYENNRHDGSNIALESSLIGRAFIYCFEDYVFPPEGWTGTATELLCFVNNKFNDDTAKKSKYWPSTARKLAGDLRRIAPNLRQEGYEIKFQRTDQARNIIISRNHDANDGNDGFRTSLALGDNKEEPNIREENTSSASSYRHEGAVQRPNEDNKGDDLELF